MRFTNLTHLLFLHFIIIIIFGYDDDDDDAKDEGIQYYLFKMLIEDWKFQNFVYRCDIISLHWLHRVSYNSLFILSNLDTHTQFVSSYYVKSLYMFRAGSPIIRRFVRVLYTQLTGLPTLICCRLDRWGWNNLLRLCS